MRLVFLLLSLLLPDTGISQQNCRNCEKAVMRTRFYKPELRAYVLLEGGRDTRYLFYDSMIIAEDHALSLVKDAKNHETWRRWIYGYAFLDVRTKSFYRYRHFSDTARFYRKTRPVGEETEEGGWNYFGKPRIPHVSVPLTDTVIDGEKCHRLQGFFMNKGDTVLSEIMYYMREKERPLIHLNKTIVNGERFSVIRMEDVDAVTKSKTQMVMDIVSRNLTKRELKVFAAWKRNAARHPVPE